MKAMLGDKIQIKESKLRAIVKKLNGRKIVVVTDDGKHYTVSSENITNYSLAARKAWNRMPNRRVGRPIGTKRTDRISVTLRIDKVLWDEFKLAEEAGLITDRTVTINAWIRDKLIEAKNSQ